MGIILERYLSGFTSALILVSDADHKKAERFSLAPSEKMVVIKNGVDFSDYQKINVSTKLSKIRELNLESSKPIVGTVARLHRQKGLIYLLKAVKKIAQSYPEVKMLIIGDGPLREKLKRKTQRLGIEKWVSFLGERKDIPALLSLFDVFVLPSLWEGLPFALIEAAALEKAVAVTKVDGIKEIVRDRETGILFPPKNPESLAQAVISLLQDREASSYMAEKLKKEIYPQYTLSRMVEETQNLYLKEWRLFSFSQSK